MYHPLLWGVPSWHAAFLRNASTVKTFQLAIDWLVLRFNSMRCACWVMQSEEERSASNFLREKVSRTLSIKRGKQKAKTVRMFTFWMLLLSIIFLAMRLVGRLLCECSSLRRPIDWSHPLQAQRSLARRLSGQDSRPSRTGQSVPTDRNDAGFNRRVSHTRARRFRERKRERSVEPIQFEVDPLLAAFARPAKHPNTQTINLVCRFSVNRIPRFVRLRR